MRETSIQLQIYYEIAMSIGNSLELPVMLKQSLSAYLRKLNCSAGVVLQLTADGKEKAALAPIFSIPRRFNQNPTIQQGLDMVTQGFDPSRPSDYLQKLPITGSTAQGKSLCVMVLPDFGALLLIKGGQPLPTTVVKSLQPLNKKLAGACRACFQSEKAERLVEQLQCEIHQRKKVENRLLASTQKYQDIFENIQDVYYESLLDGTLVEMSPSIKHVIGVPREELIGRSIGDFYIDIGQRHRMIEIIKRQGQVFDYEIDLRYNDGDVVNCSINAVLQKDDSGRPTKMIGSMRDISKRKQAENALLLSKNEAECTAKKLKEANEELRKLHRAVEQSPTAVLITDHEGRIEYVNPTFTRLTGYTYEEAVGHKPQMLQSGQHGKAFYDDLWQTISSGRVWEGELLNKTKDSRMYWEQSFIAPVKDNTGQITHYIALKEDITWRKEAEANLVKAQEAIDEANAARSQFLANMSHEIRTPLNGVIGMTALLLDTPLEPEQHDMASTIRVSADSLMAAVNNILDYAKIMADQLNLESTRVDLKAVLDDVLAIMKPQIGDKVMKLYHEVGSDVPLEVRGDHNRLKQVMINLVDNAIKFTDSGKVAIELTTISETAGSAIFRFSVTDTGIGIADDYQTRIFDSFSQQDNSMTRRYGGTGLGLAISKALVEAMGGTIGLSSQLGHGTTFWFTVELEKQIDGRRSNKAAAIGVFAAEGESTDSTRARILVAEDNIINQKLTLKILEKLGYEAMAVVNGREAVAALAEDDFNLVLMDIQMPEMDGLEAARTIRSAHETVKNQHVPIIALTAHTMKGDRQACLDAGMDDYLPKPINPKQLAESIEKHLQACA